MTKSITIPPKTVSLLNDKGEKVEERRIFTHLLGIIVESTPQNTDTETFLAHAIREKIDALTSESEEMELEEAELSFTKNGIDKLRAAGKIVGSNWYYLMSALNGAVAKPKLSNVVAPTLQPAVLPPQVV